MIANFYNRDSTLPLFKPTQKIVMNPNTSVKFIIVGEDVKTAKTKSEIEEIKLHLREQEILRQQDDKKKQEDLIQQKLKVKWYNVFKNKHNKKSWKEPKYK
jgi:hypothetical protein